MINAINEVVLANNFKINFSQNQTIRI